MGPEANIDLIRALEKQIEEGVGDIIKLKRERNSLLNISTCVPPEILGHIFTWNLVRVGRFEGLQMGSYNFLLVCHHWFEVASRTPELWSFWGNTLQDWKKRHGRSGATPLDLVLDGYEPESDPRVPFDESLQDAVRCRVIQGTIRQVHLRFDDHTVLTPIISSLTPNGEGGQNENIESIVWENEGDTDADISNFFARSRLSRLRVLDLRGWTLSWDHLASKFLTILSLDVDTSPSLPTLTAARLFSILTSNPNLRTLSLSRAAIPSDTDTSTFKVQLRHLKSLALTGGSRHVYGLLRQLILQEALDDMWLSGSNSTVEDISQTLAPYMQDYFQRGTWLRGGLGVYSSSSPSVISLSVGAVPTQTTGPVELPYVSLKALTDFPPPPGVPEQLFASLAAVIPGERIVSFHAWLGMLPPEEVFFMMPNIEELAFSGLLLSEGLLQPNPGGPHANMKLFPSLRSLRLEHVWIQAKDDWSHLLTYLTHQTSDGQTVSLEIIGNVPNGCPVDEIRGLVREFTYPRNTVPEENE